MEDRDSTLRPWTPQERETFFAAIERHRRAVWQVGAASQACILALGLVVAILLSPLLYAMLMLILDVINFAIPTPDLMKSIMGGLDPVLDHPGTLSAGRWLYITGIAALPGLLVMGYIVYTLKRIVREAETSDAQSMQARMPDPTALAEQRFANVTQEMALAANIPPPRVRVVDNGGANAAVYGESDRGVEECSQTAMCRRECGSHRR